MTKKHLAELIRQCIDNAEFIGESDDLKVEAIISLLDTLEPKHLEQFANWGYPEQKSTPKECWK